MSQKKHPRCQHSYLYIMIEKGRARMRPWKYSKKRHAGRGDVMTGFLMGTRVVAASSAASRTAGTGGVGKRVVVVGDLWTPVGERGSGEDRGAVFDGESLVSRGRVVVSVGVGVVVVGVGAMVVAAGELVVRGEGIVVLHGRAGALPDGPTDGQADNAH